MLDRILSEDNILLFKQNMAFEEKSKATIEKYIRDIKLFHNFADDRFVNKELVIEYKNSLIDKGYSIRSINSMLASINSLFSFLGWFDCRVKSLKIQQEIFRPEEKELSKAEYIKLVKTAQKKHNERLCLILQTICGTGIRVSELQYITVEAVQKGSTKVVAKLKIAVFLLLKNSEKNF